MYLFKKKKLFLQIKNIMDYKMKLEEWVLKIYDKNINYNEKAKINN